MAKPLPHYIDVDLKRDTQYRTATVTQNDTDVVFILRVTDDGRADESILDDFSTITLTSRRTDKKSFYVVGDKIPGTNEIRFELGTSEIELTGKVAASAQLYSVDGRKSTVHFTYQVEKDLTGDYVPSENEASLIERVLVDGPHIMAEAEQATIDAIQAMNDLTGAVSGALDTLQTDKATALEEMRLSREATETATAATLDATADTIAEREATETVRANTESVRIATESERQATATVRQNTEAVRAATETERQNTAAEREATTTVRENTETVRVNTEAVRVATEGVRTSTVAARDETITATGNAVTATTSANTAAGNANTAAGRANTSADNADLATGRANSAADAVEDALENGPVISVNGQNGAVVLDAASVGAITSTQADTKDAAVLQSAKEYADGLEPDLTGYATVDSLNTKVDKVAGKQLSTEDYTAAEKTKLSGVATGANNYSHPASHPASMITGLSGVATSGDFNDLANKPTIPAPVTVSTSVTSTSTTTAASSSAVKTANDNALASVNRTGDTMTGILTAQTNTSYTVRQVRNMILSAADASVGAMQNGDIWIKYK